MAILLNTELRMRHNVDTSFIYLSNRLNVLLCVLCSRKKGRGHTKLSECLLYQEDTGQFAGNCPLGALVPSSVKSVATSPGQQTAVHEIPL